VDPGERAFFDEHGWLVVRGAADPALLRELEASFDRVFPRPMMSRAREGDAWQVLGAARHHAPVWSWLRNDALASRAAALMGATRVQLLQDTFLCKPPRVGGAIDWHQDYVYTGYLEPARAVSVRLALSACTVESGCLQVLDGSHRWGWRAQPRILADNRVRDTLDDLPEELRSRVEESTRTLELEPGDLTVHHCLTLHRSRPNVGAEARKTIIAHVFDGDCHVVRERLPAGAQAHFVTDDAGRLTGENFPTLFSASG
jgi:ectoine hydroxylase-related dioxygenase (phytanoyl-CoA dioxygenase family)